MAGLILKIIVINMSGKCLLGPSFACLKKTTSYAQDFTSYWVYSLLHLFSA